MAKINKKVLVVEDDNLINSMYRAKFEADGYGVVVASDGASGLELARKEKPDIILLDVIMTQLDGFSVLKELKKDAKTKNIPVIMLTNLGTSEDKAKGEMMGAVDYLIKSNFTPAQISEKIAKVLKIKK